MATPDSLGLEDGSYWVDVALEGGSGRAGVDSPAKLTVRDGQAEAELLWSSGNYDYMKVDGVQYNAEMVEGRSCFVDPGGLLRPRPVGSGKYHRHEHPP